MWNVVIQRTRLVILLLKAKLRVVLVYSCLDAAQNLGFVKVIYSMLVQEGRSRHTVQHKRALLQAELKIQHFICLAFFIWT